MNALYTRWGGMVTRVSFHTGMGCFVEVATEKWLLRYGNLFYSVVEQGETLCAGQLIGYGPHDEAKTEMVPRRPWLRVGDEVVVVESCEAEVLGDGAGRVMARVGGGGVSVWVWLLREDLRDLPYVAKQGVRLEVVAFKLSGDSSRKTFVSAWPTKDYWVSGETGGKRS